MKRKSMIEIKNISKVYETKEGSFQALDDVSLTINDGDVFGIIGSSGAGKSTLVRHINLLERPTSGRVVIDGTDVTDYSGKELRDLRTKIGMIFQSFALFQQASVLKNVLFPLEVRKADDKKAKEKALELIKLVGLEGMEHRYPSQLSGGQQQRVAIARALATDPEIILCDEATSALDSKTTVQILDLLKDINDRLGVTMILITHSMEVAQHICNRIAVVDKGHIVEEGATDDIFANPQHPVTKELISHHQAGRE